MKQRFLSIFLALALIIPFFPQVTLPAKAAETTAKTQDENSNENTDAFGIKMDTTIDTKKEKANNPYGTEGWVNLFTVPELFVSQGYDGYRSFETYNYNNDRDHKEGSIGSITDGTRIGKKEEGNKNGFTIMDTAPVDAEGEGQKRYVAVLGYWLGGKRLELYIADKDGNRVSNTYAIGGEKTLDYLEQADAFEDTGFVSVAAGDFNGDGKDTVIAYAPLMESDSEQPQLWEFSIGSNMQLEKTGTVCNIFDILGTGNIATKHSNNGKVFRNTPVVQMTTADTDKDSVDELVVTAGMNNTKADVNNRQSRMFIYDNITEEEKSYWNKTFELDTKGYNNGNQRLRWASSSVGNLVMTGSGADYPEIITAGWVDKKTNKDADLTHDIGAYVTSCSKTTKKGNSAIGTYAKSEVPAIGSNGQPQVSGFTKDGHYRDDVQSLVVVDTFAADGVNAKASVLIMDTIYTYEAGKGLNEEYRTDYFNHSDNGIGTSIITNGLVQDAVSGNFSGNEEGREQIVFTTCQKRASKNQYFYKTYTYKKTGKSFWQCNSTGYRISKKGNAYTSLCAPDIDSDSTIARIKDVSLTYTEPEVLALLESTPYFSEVDEGDIGNSETAYGKENGEGTSVSTAEGLTTNIVAGFEWSVDDICAGFVCGAGFETSVEQGYTWETATSTTKKFSLNYSNDTGENQVIVYRRPVTTYRYEIKGTKDTMVLARQGTLLTSMLPVDEYNEAAQSYELEEIADGTLATPGNPFSYRSSTAGLNNVAESKITTQYGKEGTVTQEFSTETEQEKTFTYDLNASFTAYGLVFGVKAGGGAGTTYSESQSTINTEAITKTGAVTGKQVEGYDFNWKFAHWTTKVNGTEIPVLGYVLTNVIAPPSPPENLAVESVTSDSAKITWDAGERGADEYRIYQIYSDGSDIQIGTVDGTESTYEVTGLKPDTSYTYAIKAYKEGKKGDAISGESVFSEKLIVTTLPEKMGTVTITNPENASVKIGGSAVFKADLSSTASDYRATNYKWQRREKGGKWQTIDGAKSSKLTLNDLTEADNNTEYRCIFRVSYTSASSLIEYYSKAATLTVGETAVAPELTITGHDNTGNGTLAKPYAGKSNYNKKTGTTTQEIKTTKNITIEKSGTQPELTVYTDGDQTAPKYYGVGKDENDNIVYYHALYDVYHKADTKVVVGRNETYTVSDTSTVNGKQETTYENESQYGFALVTISSGETTTYTITSIQEDVEETYTVGDTELAGFDPAKLTLVTKQVINIVETPVYTTQAGDSLTLRAKVTEKDNSKAAAGASVEFKIVNTQTNGVETISATTDANGAASAKWTAATSGLYSIQVNVLAKSGYTASATKAQYYNAGGTYETNTTEYRLVLSSAGKTLTGTMTYGGSVSYELQERAITVSSDAAKAQTVGEWKKSEKTNLTYTVETTEKDRKKVDEVKQPLSVASYNFRVYDGDTIDSQKELAAAALQVTKAAVTITPEIKNGVTPSSASDITLKVEPEISGVNLNDVLNVNCGYFTDKTATGKFDVILSYKTDSNGAVTDKVKAFQNNYTAVFESASFTVKPDSAQVKFSCGENGTIVGRYADNWYPMASGSNQTKGTRLRFAVAPNSGYGVAKWIINGTDYAVDAKNLPEGMRISEDGKILDVASFNPASQTASTNPGHTKDGVLTVEVSFKSTSHEITYNVDGKGGTLTAVNENDKKINSGTKITQGSKVTFTAEPEEGYIVSGWKVDGKTYKWQDKDEDYLGTTLVLEDISKDENVIVSFKKSTASYKVITSVADEDGKTDTSLAKVTAINAETKEAVTDLTSIKEGTTLTFTASVADKTNHMVKLWQTSKDGKTWEDAALSGGSNTFTLYNISENLYIRSVITIAQKYSLKYKVVLDDGKPSETIVTDKKIAELTATSNGQEITSGDSHSAYIPVEFALTLNNDYYVTGWSKNVKAGEDLSAASLEALDCNTEVVVTIKEKPVVTIPSGISNGTLTVIYKDAANKDISVSNGDHVPNGTQLLVTLTPEKGYVVDADALGTSVETEYTDEDKSGNTTDTKAYKVENVTANVTVKGAFKALRTHKVTYEPVIASGESANGTLTAKADRKQMDIYKIDKLTTGEKVYEGSTLTFTAAPDQDYSVQEWRVNGKVLKEDGIKVTDSTLTIANVEKDYTVTVQFKKSGSDTTIAAGANGKIVSAVAGKVDQIANIESGFVLASGATVDITAQPDTGYKVGCWKVNGKVVDGQTGNTYTYTADEKGTGAAITVQFVQIDYAVSWSAVNGTVKAEDTSGTEYEGNKADIRGGSQVTFSATPKEAYKVSCWKVNGEAVDGENGDTFTFTVPSGAKEIPEVASYKVEAVCEKDQFTLTYAQPSNGTLTARGAAGEVASGDKVNGDEKYTFTVKPDADYIVESWKVDGQVIDSHSTSYEVTVKKNTEVSVRLVPASYKVTYKVNNEQGKLLVGKDTEEKTDGEISAAYGTSIKFTAVSNKFCHIKGWKLDGTEVTDTTEGISISADGSELTLSEVKKEHSVEAIFDAATMYEVSYEVDETSEGVASNAGTLNAKAGNTDLKLKKDQTTTVEGGKTLTFTAVPVSADFMVAGWYVNGKKVENELSNTCVIEKLDKKVHVTVQFTQYKGYALPVSGEGYALSEMKRTPDDTTPDTEIRENGTLSFKVAPDTDNKYIRIDKLVINGYDCLADKLSEGKEQPENCTLVEVQKNEDGSYVITVSGITGEIQTDITAHKHTLKKVDKVNPTCTKAGNKEYWICEDENCKEMFLEEAAMKAVQWKDILLPATGHNYQNGICKNCGAKDPTYVDIHPGTPKVKAKAKGDRKIKLSWSKAKDAQGYIVYRYNAKTRKYAVIANTKKTAYTDKKRTPGTVYRYLVKAYGVSLNKKVIYGQVSNCASAVTKPQTPKITSVKKAGTTKAAIQLKTERNVKGYQLYEYMWQTKKFKLVGKIEGKKYYKYDSKKKKFTRDRKSKVVQNAKKKTISVKITTNSVNFKRYRRYRFKVRSYVKYNGKQIFSKLSKQKIVTR